MQYGDPQPHTENEASSGNRNMFRVREKVCRNSSGFRFNVNFVDCTSVFVKSVLEASLQLIPLG